MRFNVEIVLEEENIPKDKNRIILSFLKSMYKLYDEEYYKYLYEEEENKVKDFTFSLYMPRCKFTREEIIIPEKRLILNFSTANTRDGIFFYNSAIGIKGKPYEVGGNAFTINRINMIKEKNLTNECAIFSTMSPIVVREHSGNNKKTWYHSLNEEKGRKIFIDNLRYQLLDYFDDDRKFDIEELDIEVLVNKEVKVKHYGIEVLSNICKIKVYSKPYILDYLYKAGMGSRKSSGFGMVDLV